MSSTIEQAGMKYLPEDSDKHNQLLRDLANGQERYWKTHPLNFWLLKWVVFPAIALLLLWRFGWYFYNVERCRRLAAEQGYVEFYYIPRTRFDPQGSECRCSKKQNPDGTIDEKAELRIPLR